MRYVAVLSREGDRTLAEFPDCPGCQTYAEADGDIAAEARDALVGWLEATLQVGEVPPRPTRRAPRHAKVLWIEVPPRLAVQIALRQARASAGLTQAQLARRAGVSQPAIAKLEDPDSNPTIETLDKVAKALGARLEVRLEVDA